MKTITQVTTVTPNAITPLDALWTLIQSQTKAVRKALVKRILDQEAKLGDSKLSEKVRQEAMVKESLTKAFDELHSGKTKHDARALFTQ
jgi:hypothetical protein